MPGPTSGQISFSSLNQTLGLSSNQANTCLGGTGTYSCALTRRANSFGVIDTNSPFRASEFYCYNNVKVDCLRFYMDASKPTSFPGSGTILCDPLGCNLSITRCSGVGYSSANSGYFTTSGGANCLMYMTHTSQYNIENCITIEAWVCVNTSNYHMIVTKQPTGNVANNFPGNYEFRVAPDYSLEFLYQVNEFQNFRLICSAANVVPIGVWRHVLVTSGGDSYGGTKFYVNSVLCANRGIFGTVGNIVAVNPTALLLMARKDGLYFSGGLAYTAIYQGILTHAEVCQNYCANKARFGL